MIKNVKLCYFTKFAADVISIKMVVQNGKIILLETSHSALMKNYHAKIGKPVSTVSMKNFWKPHQILFLEVKSVQDHRVQTKMGGQDAGHQEKTGVKFEQEQTVLVTAPMGEM